MDTTVVIWQNFSDHLRNFIRKKVGNQQDVEDLLQDVFVKVHTNLCNLKEQQKLQQWIFRIARNVINDYYRHTKRNMPNDAEEYYRFQMEEDDERDLTNCLLPFVDSLPEKYREAVELSELKGWKQQQVATHLGISLSGAKSRVQRGREMIKQQFVDCCNFSVNEKGKLIGAVKETCPNCD
jgi:RNA polymerase sigma-70 factor (ECF subfamily)